MIANYMPNIANLHEERFQKMADGEIYNTIVNGKGLMGPFGERMTVHERWAVVSYLRALQQSQNTNLSEVEKEFNKNLK